MILKLFPTYLEDLDSDKLPRHASRFHTALSKMLSEHEVLWMVAVELEADYYLNFGTV